MNTRVMGLIATMVLAPFTLAQPSGGPPPALVRFDEARQQEVMIMRSVSGSLFATRRSMVAAEEEGLVRTLSIDVGDIIEEGHVIATLDPRRAQIEVNRLEAEEDGKRASVSVAESSLRQAERDYARLTDAQNAGSVSDSEIEDAQISIQGMEARVRVAQADLVAAMQELAFARQVLEDRTIRAPFNGQIVAKHTEVGAWVGVGGTVVELVGLDTIDAYIGVPESYLSTLRAENTTVQLEIPALNELIESSDVTVIASGDQLARTFPIRVRLKNPDGALKPGMSVRALVPTSRNEEAVTIHKDALLRDGGGAFAYMNAGGVAIPVRFEVRWRVGDRFVVRGANIKPGTQFVIEGNERLFPSQPLNDLDNPQQPAPAQQGG